MMLGDFVHGIQYSSYRRPSSVGRCSSNLLFMVCGSLLLCVIHADSTDTIQVQGVTGGSITLDCEPNQNTINITWTSGGRTIHPTTKYSFHPLKNISRAVLKISNLTLNDRVCLTCHLKLRGGEQCKKVFRVRVRDHYGALWPSIGILVEAVVLFIVIKIAECFTKRGRNVLESANRVHPSCDELTAKKYDDNGRVHGFDSSTDFNPSTKTN